MPRPLRAVTMTVPPLPKGQPMDGQQNLPETPKTAPQPFVPTTPHKKNRPAVTPMSVAVFKRQRCALAEETYKE